MLLNFALLIPAFLSAIYYPQIGNLAGLMGGFATMFCIYILPTVVYAKMMHTAISNPELMIAIKDDLINHENAEEEED